MRTANVTDGLRGTRDVQRDAPTQFPPHLPEAKGKRVFVFYKGNTVVRGAYVELQAEKSVVAGGEKVVTQEKLAVHAHDGIVVLNPEDPVEAKKIQLIEAHAYYESLPDKPGGGILKIRDRRTVIAEQADERVKRHLEEQAALLADPVIATRLRQLSGKGGFDPIDLKQPEKTAADTKQPEKTEQVTQ